MGGLKSTITIIDEWCADNMDNIKFDDENVDINKVKSLIMDMLNKSERLNIIDFKSDNLELVPDEFEYRLDYEDKLYTIFYKILINKETSVIPYSLSIINLNERNKINLELKVIATYKVSINDEPDAYYDINGKYFNHEIILIEDLFDPSDIMKGDTNGSI